MVGAPDIAVAVPAVAEIERLDLLRIALVERAVIVGADAGEAHADHQPEEFPVVVGEVAGVPAPEIVGDLRAGAGVERLPELVGHEAQGKADRRQLDQPLVNLARPAPEFRMIGIAAIGETARDRSPIDPVGAARLRRSQPPEQASIALHVRRRLVEMGSGRGEA